MQTDVILFLGQSNMQGQTERLSECEPVEGALEYRFLTDTLETLKNPVGENIRYGFSAGYRFEEDTDIGEWLRDHAAGEACFGNTNMVPEFCRAYVKGTGRKVVAVHIAKGSTDVACWVPGNAGYSIIKTKASAALAKVGAQNIGHLFAVWLQGESDAVCGTPKETYKTRLTALKDGLKRDAGVEKFCIIKVGAFTCDSRDEEIYAAQEELCATDPDFVMLTRITAELLKHKEYCSPVYGGHYSAAGQEAIGRSAGSALALLVNGQT
ncbi:MAG: hypothetical protein ILO64_05285 [Clostridia bacterium]|nr:hypothetical protein [Clostridia bacterium]